MSLWAIVPAKAPDQAKSRLGSVLSPGRRRSLSLHLLEATLHTLSNAPRVDRCLVISGSTEPLAVARRYSALTIHELGGAPLGTTAARSGGVPFAEPERGLNTALRQAAAVAVRSGADTLLILPADLLLLDVETIEHMIAALPPGGGVVIAPDRHRTGTNALLMRPPRVLPFLFGPHSFERHRVAAAERGLPTVVYDDPALALDLDTPADIELLAAIEPRAPWLPDPTSLDHTRGTLSGTPGDHTTDRRTEPALLLNGYRP